jgi:hypothetical protein
LMNHWRLALGGDICEVAYEDLVRQPQTVGAAVAEHCGLAWQASATQVENNAGASFTASATQVRRAIYTSSVDRWRHYSKHLEPLACRLTDLGVNLNGP